MLKGDYEKELKKVQPSILKLLDFIQAEIIGKKLDADVYSRELLITALVFAADRFFNDDEDEQKTIECFKALVAPVVMRRYELNRRCTTN